MSEQEFVKEAYLYMHQRKTGLVSTLPNENLLALEPAICARLRNPAQFKAFPYEKLLQGAADNITILPDKSLAWCAAQPAATALCAVGLSDEPVLSGGSKRRNLIESAVKPLRYYYANELRFISAYTSCIIWLTSESIGSAAFDQLPHCTLFSDSALASIPPSHVLNKELVGLAIIENLFHEALHHKMHLRRALSGIPFLRDELAKSSRIQVLGRERDFSVLEAFHALHVYGQIVLVRRAALSFPWCRGSSEEAVIEMLKSALASAVFMRDSLAKELVQYRNQFNNYWTSLLDCMLTNDLYEV